MHFINTYFQIVIDNDILIRFNIFSFFYCSLQSFFNYFFCFSSSAIESSSEFLNAGRHYEQKQCIWKHFFYF